MEIINLDMVPGKKSPVCHASQFDEGRVIRFNLYDSGLPFSLDGTESITFEVRKPDGNIVTSTLTNTSDSYVDVVTTEQMTAVKGANLCEVRIEKGETNIGSLNVIMAVEMDPTDGGIESASEIDNLRSQVNEMVAEEVAEQYDSANVIFDNVPTSGHGTPYTVTSEGIKTAIDNAFDYDNTASGSLVHIEDGADNIPVKSLVSEIVAVETGTGEKSPDNPYTISGFDSGIIPRLGKNFVEFSTTTITTQTRILDNIYLKAGVYTFSIDVNNTTNIAGTFNIRIGTTSIDTVGFVGNYQGGVNKTFTLSQDSTINIVLGGASAGYSFTISNAQIELGDTASEFEAYNGNTYTFAFGETVYGGRFDNKGNLVVTHSKFDLGSVNWAMPVNGLFRTSTSNVPNIKTQYLPNWLCDIYEVKSATDYAGWQNRNMAIGFLSSYSDIICVNSDYTDATTFKNAMSGHYLVYELATPITLSITSQDIPTLLGENNIFSDCGNVEVTYYTSKSNDILEFINSEIGKKNGTNIPIEENSQDSIKTYIDNEVSNTKDYVDNGLSGKADSTDLPFVKYQEIDVTFDASGEGTLFNSVKFVVGLKDIPSDQLYVGYVSYIAGNTIKIKALSRTAITFSSQNNVSSTRKVGVYYIDNIATQ